MDDRRIEEMLRKSWTPAPPDGMKDRILRRTREELLSRPVPSRWKFALVTAGLLVVMISGISDHARQIRMAAMMDGHTASPVVASDTKASYFSWRRQLEVMLAATPAQADTLNGPKGDDLL